MNYYNEYEPFAVEWLKELIEDGLIPAGDVDSRSITEVEPSDLHGYNQCHFFAGIGGWAYAARLAGWADDRPMWTGSPPCQPFSVAGKRKGTDDERHLWPVWFNLVRECKPSIIFGEQVAAAIRQGWLDSLQEDLEAENYACAAAVLPASGIGALHKRDRLWIVAHSIGERSQGRISGWQDTQWQMERGHSGRGSATDITMADSNDIGHQWNEGTGRQAKRRAKYASSDCFWSVGDTEHSGSHGSEERGSTKTTGSGSAQGQDISLQSQGAGGCSESGDICGHSFWSGIQAVQCKDGKVRAIPTEPEIFPMANGVSNRVGTLRGAGNAIVPQVAAEIIRAFV